MSARLARPCPPFQAKFQPARRRRGVVPNSRSAPPAFGRSGKLCLRPKPDVRALLLIVSNAPPCRRYWPSVDARIMTNHRGNAAKIAEGGMPKEVDDQARSCAACSACRRRRALCCRSAIARTSTRSPRTPAAGWNSSGSTSRGGDCRRDGSCACDCDRVRRDRHAPARAVSRCI